MNLRAASALIIVFAAGCTSSAQNAEQESPVRSSEGEIEIPPTNAPVPSPGTLGHKLSEDAFKKLHVHKDGAAPALLGKPIMVGGQKAYLSMPKDKKGPLPAVIVIHEWWGLNENIMHWTDRLAAEGYAALAVDLYQGKATTSPDEAMKLMKSVDDAHGRKVLAAARGFLQEEASIKATKIGSVGWCFGGGWSLNLALQQPIDATVIYYGRLVTDAKALAPIKGKVLGIFGNLDEGIPPKEVDAFEAALNEAKIPNKIHRFDANHAFANPSSGRYDEASAAKAWRHTRAFFQANLN